MEWKLPPAQKHLAIHLMSWVTHFGGTEKRQQALYHIRTTQG